eukprot:11237045-Alexandrium_andersonii.AAC.1
MLTLTDWLPRAGGASPGSLTWPTTRRRGKGWLPPCPRSSAGAGPSGCRPRGHNIRCVSPQCALRDSLAGCRTCLPRVRMRAAQFRTYMQHPVSYTHLTLPTICSV